MNGMPGQTVRVWRLRPWSKNEVMRAGDRLESSAFVLVVAVLLVMLPVAWFVGSAVDNRLDERTRADLVAKQEVPAVLVENPTIGSWGSSQLSPAIGRAEARWVVGGRTHSAQVPTEPGAKSGDTTSVWIDDTGSLVDAPTTPTENTSTAVAVGIIVWNTAATLCFLAFVAVQWLARKVEGARCDREWESLGKSSGGHKV